MKNKQAFEELQSDFYHYMITEGEIARKTSGDYISRLRFLAQSYLLDDSITLEYIEEILKEENTKRMSRDVYSSKKAMSDFRSGLIKFYTFIHSDYHKRIQDSIISEIKRVEKATSLQMTEKTAIIQSRIGQGVFRT